MRLWLHIAVAVNDLISASALPWTLFARNIPVIDALDVCISRIVDYAFHSCFAHIFILFQVENLSAAIIIRELLFSVIVCSWLICLLFR